MSILRNIQRKIHKFSGGFFANWLPPDHVDVGDFGFIRNEKFQRSGSLRDLGLEFDIEQTEKTDGQLKFTDGTKMTIAPSLGAEAPIFKGAKASVALEFSGRGAFLYHLAGINQRRFRNPPEFFKQLAAKILAGEIVLEDDAVLLDEVKTADKATIVVSENKSGKFNLQVSFRPGQDEFLASAKGKIAANHAYGNFLQWIAAGSTIPLIHPIRPIFSVGTGGPTPLSKFIEQIKFALGRKPQIDEIDLRYHTTSPQSQKLEFHIKAADLSAIVQFREVSVEEFLNEFEMAGELVAEPAGLTLSNIESINLSTDKKYDYDASWGAKEYVAPRFHSLRAACGTIDDVIMPHSTRKRLVRALAMLKNKHVEVPKRKHDNLPVWVKMSGERRIVYFLGAGASFGAGAYAPKQGGGRIPIPTQSTFWETFLRFCRSRRNKKDIEAFLYRYFLDYGKVPGRTSEAARRRQLAPIDVEEVFTFLSERNNAPSVSPQFKTYTLRVWNALLNEIGQVFGRFHANNDTEHVYRLFRRRHMRTRDTIVSFNYDLIFEQSLPNNSRWYYEGIDDVHEPQSLRILKPHGSINWEEVNGWITSHNVHGDLPDRPVVVAPTHLKFIGRLGQSEEGALMSGYLNQSLQISDVWNAMEREMRDAKAWVFIGYSFPSSDLYFSSVLRSTLAVRDGNPLIVIVNPDSMTIGQRIVTRFSIPANRIRAFPNLQTFNQIDRRQMLSTG